MERRIVQTVRKFIGPDGKAFYSGKAEVWTGSSAFGSLDALYVTARRKKRAQEKLNKWLEEKLKN